jgi:hypothetical protein
VELILSNILSTISRERIRYLGILSTDIRDQIFLAQEIRRHAPDVVLFTLTSDLIYTHTDVNLDFQGMLLVSTYPLFPRNQLWTYPFAGSDYRHQFPNDSTQGVYNAALALLGHVDQMLEYGIPYDYQSVPPRQPPVWLSAVGKNGIWPVRLLTTDRYAVSDYLLPGSSVKSEDVKKISRGWFVSPGTFFILVCLSIVLLLVSIVVLLKFPPNWLLRRQMKRVKRWRNKKIWLLNNLSDATLRENRPLRRLYLFAFCVVVLTLGFTINRIVVRLLICNPLMNTCDAELNPGTQHLVAFELFSLLIVLLLEAPILIAAWVLFKVTYPPTTSMRQRIGLLVNPIASVPLAILLLLVAYGSQVSFLEPPNALFFYMRMLNPGNGLSPLLPLIFVGAGGTLWLISNLRRLRLLEEFPAHYVYVDEKSLSKIEKAQHRIRELLICPSLYLRAQWHILFFVGFPCCYFFIYRLTPALEERPFYWLFGLTFVSAYIALSLSFWRLWLVWWSTRDLLRRIAAHPIQHAYQKLIKKFSRAPRLSFSNPSTNFSALEFSCDQARALILSESQLLASAPNLETRNNYRYVLKQLKSCVLDAQEKTLESDREEANDNWSKALRLRSQAHGLLSQASLIVVHLLKPHWSSRTAAPRNDKQNWFVLAEYFLAGRTAVFIHHLFLHLQNILFSVMAGLLLMLLAVSSYPFQPGDQLLLFNWAIILTVVVLSVLILVQINRNSIISLLAGINPGEVSWNQEFIMKLVIYGLVPILALIGAQFPETLRSIVSSFGLSQDIH